MIFFEIFTCEIEQLSYAQKEIMGEIEEIIEKIAICEGKIILCGMGKLGHIGRKIAATMSSYGIPAIFLHPAEGVHGDLGVVQKDDVVIIISNSGETEEVRNILKTLKTIGAVIVAITAYGQSGLAQAADYRILYPMVKEAGTLKLAPTSSTTVELVIGDALAVAAAKRKKFTKEQFALYHPSGTLGKRLLTSVRNLMHQAPVILSGSTIQMAVVILCQSGLGAVLITDNQNKLLGIITDGDLKRFLERKIDVYTTIVDQTMVTNPVTIEQDMLAIDALQQMEKRKTQISVLPVVGKDNEVLGLLRLHDIINFGIL